MEQSKLLTDADFVTETEGIIYSYRYDNKCLNL